MRPSSTGSHDPSREFSLNFVADHGLECSGEVSRFHEQRDAFLDRGDGDRLDFRKGVTSNRH
jgi:hypothetical protein